jgi:ABC-type lipoprotein release transport system permease subunit
LLQWRLYRVAPYDPPTLVAVALGLTVIAGVVALLPARRALTLDPVATLRAE